MASNNQGNNLINSVPQSAAFNSINDNNVVNNLEIKEDKKETQEEILRKEFNNLQIQSQNLKNENGKLNQRIKEIKDMIINKTSKKFC